MHRKWIIFIEKFQNFPFVFIYFGYDGYDKLAGWDEYDNFGYDRLASREDYDNDSNMTTARGRGGR